jgi:chorismate mutase/prephenate dehydratase
MAENERLAAVRKDIDAVDEQLISLFRQRMALADQVAEIKSQCNIALVDSKRENEIVKKAVECGDPQMAGETATFIRSLMGLSKSRQRLKLYGTADEYYFPQAAEPKVGPLKVGFQGVRGAWGEQASIQLFRSAELQDFTDFEDVFAAVKDKKVDYGVVPIENSQTGGISDVHDLLRKYGCYIVGQTWVTVMQCLMATPGARLDDIRQVFSHPEGLKQCSKYLRGRGWEQTACRNTAVAAQMVSESGNKKLAAIGSRRAAQLNGLSILAPDIVNDMSNKTRFILISDTPEYDDTCDTVSLIFRTANRSGALMDALFPMVSENINIKRLESRPVGDGKYCFYCDIQGSVLDENVQNALRQVAACCSYLDVLGCYREDTEQR